MAQTVEVELSEEAVSIINSDLDEEEIIEIENTPAILNIELLGKSVVFLNATYEHNFNRNIGIGIGLSFTMAQSGTITREVNYQTPDQYTEDGKYIDLAGTIPIYLITKQGKGKHRLIQQIGVTTMISLFHNRYPSGTEIHNETKVIPFASIGYEYEGERVVFRLPIYIGYIGDEGFFPAVVPWVGVSLGVKLGNR